MSLSGLKSYNVRFIAAVLAALFVILCVLSTVMYFTAADILEEQIGKNAQIIATSVAAFIKNDIGSYREFAKTQDTGSAYYSRMRDALSSICGTESVRFIYTEQYIDNNSVAYLLDSEPLDSDYFSAPGTLDSMNPLREKAYGTHEPCYSGLVSTEGWGLFTTGYSPITDPANGEFLGLVGVDISYEFHQHLFQYYLWTLIIAVLITVLIVGAVLLIFSGSSSFVLVHDNLTGAFNRKFFDKLLKRMCSLTYPRRKEFCLLMMDLDKFKLVNDTYGHQFGDMVLKATVSATSSALRSDDVLARYGGEEFMIILPNTSLDEALTISERIRDAVSKNLVYNDQLHEYKTVTISIGAASHEDKLASEKLIFLADSAMYEAKKERNAVAYYDPESRQHKLDRTRRHEG